MIINYVVEKNINEYVRKYAEYVLKDQDFYKSSEGYKYRAVATFREHFDLQEKDLHGMLVRALAHSHNLVQSGQYYPKRMLLRYANEDPEFVRTELSALLNDTIDVYKRIDSFIEKMNNHFYREDLQSYLDYRFVSFFLASYKPNRYIYAKYREFSKLADMVGYNMKISGSNGERYKTLYLFARRVRDIIKTNSEFKKVHEIITTPYDYKDPYYSWGTVDFIFNVARRFGSEFNDEVVEKIKRNMHIEQSKKDELEDMLIDDEIILNEQQRSKEELLSLINNFKPKGEGYTETQGSRRIRRDSVTQKARIKIMEDYSCQVCGFSIEYTIEDGSKRKYAHADHIIDKSNGGNEEGDNLWVLCPNCHAKKTLGVITVNINAGKIYHNGKEIRLHHNNHLSWYK